jgi:hypothetical protein
MGGLLLAGLSARIQVDETPERVTERPNKVRVPKVRHRFGAPQTVYFFAPADVSHDIGRKCSLVGHGGPAACMAQKLQTSPLSNRSKSRPPMSAGLCLFDRPAKEKHP